MRNARFTEEQIVFALKQAKRNAAAALRFFRKSIRHHDAPEAVTVDKSGANIEALATLNAGKADEESIIIRQSKYLHNLVAQDNRNIKRRIRMILRFKLLMFAQTILAGSKLVHLISLG